MTAYYNEIDPYAAQWLRNLIEAGHIAPGVVDERSIEDVRPSDLRGFTQCHFFAGIGVWSLALRRSGWPDDRPVWTGSCPCQPFSSAGAGAGFEDARHLWPTFAWLIKECKPAIIFGEQVASKAVEPWVDLVHADVEALGYAFGAVPFPSAGVGAPHIRDRLYWVAHSEHSRRQAGASKRSWPGSTLSSGADGRLAYLHINGRDQGRQCESEAGNDGFERDSTASRVGFTESLRREGECLRARSGLPEGGASQAGDSSDVANTSSERPSRWDGQSGGGYEASESERLGALGAFSTTGPVNGFWRAADWLGCRDDKWRPVEPGTFPLAHGAASRVGRLRAYGNAINASAASEFIAAYLDT